MSEIKALYRIIKILEKLSMGRHVEYIENNNNDGSSDLSSSLTELFNKERLRKYAQKACIQLFNKNSLKKDSYNQVPAKLKEIQKLFSLTSLETKILLLHYHAEVNNLVEKLINSLNEYLGIRDWHYGKDLAPKTMAALLEYPRYEIQLALQNEAALVRYGLLNEERELHIEMIQFLDGFSDKPVIQNYF